MGYEEKKEKYKRAKELGLDVKWTMKETDMDKVLSEYESSQDTVEPEPEPELEEVVEEPEEVAEEPKEEPEDEPEEEDEEPEEESKDVRECFGHFYENEYDEDDCQGCDDTEECYNIGKPEETNGEVEFIEDIVEKKVEAKPIKKVVKVQKAKSLPKPATSRQQKYLQKFFPQRPSKVSDVLKKKK